MTPRIALAALALLVAPSFGCNAPAEGNASGAEVEPPSDDVADEIEGANLTMGSSTANGLSVETVSCSLDGALGGLGLLAALAEQKDTLAACGAGKPRVQFTAKDGKLSDVRVKGATDGKAARCVADALATAKAPVDATCAMTLDLSK